MSKPKKTVVNVKPALQGYRVYLYCTSIQDDLNLESEFLNFNSNSLKVLDCLIYLGKLFHGTALPNLTLRLQ